MLVSHLHEQVDEMPPLFTGILIETQQRILSLYRTSMKDVMELVRNQVFSNFQTKRSKKNIRDVFALELNRSTTGKRQIWERRRSPSSC